MPDPDLSDLFAATEAPSRDIAFEYAVEERIARRRMGFAVAGLVVVTATLAAVLAFVWPVIGMAAGQLVRAFDPAGPTLALVAVVIVATVGYVNFMNRGLLFGDDR